MTPHEFNQMVLDRDEHMCQWPGCEACTNLDVAHLIRRSAEPSMRTFVPNGVTLCRPHHLLFDINRREREAFIAILLERRLNGFQMVPAS